MIITKLNKNLMLELNDIHCVFQGVCDKGNIYISNFPTATQLQLLRKYKIFAVITVTKSKPPIYNNYIEHMIVPVDDISSASIIDHFDTTFEFIDRVRKNGNLLVHCMAGISRSATIVIAYLMKKYSYDYQTVVSMLQRKRTKINPNIGFISQLKDFQQKIGANSRSTSLVKTRQRSKSNHKRRKSLLQRETQQQKLNQQNKMFEKTKKQNDIIAKKISNFKSKTFLSSQFSNQFARMSMTEQKNMNFKMIQGQPGLRKSHYRRVSNFA